MENVHLAPETDEDDLYSGFNDYNPAYDTEVKHCSHWSSVSQFSWFLRTLCLSVLAFYVLQTK